MTPYLYSAMDTSLALIDGCYQTPTNHVRSVVRIADCALRKAHITGPQDTYMQSQASR